MIPMNAEEIRLLIESIFVTGSLIAAGIVATWVYVHSRQRSPDALRTMQQTMAEMSDRLRVVEHDRERDHLLIMRLQAALEEQITHGKRLTERLKLAGIQDIPAAPQVVLDAPVDNDVLLVKSLAALFNLEELDDLAFQIGIAPDNLSGDTVSKRSLSLVTFARRRSKVDELIRVARALRPKGGFE